MYWHLGFPFKAGQHPRVTALLKGVSNERPPKPRYTAVWDVEQILRQLKKFPDYKEMTPKQVTLKVTMLLALTSITRGSETKGLNLEFMVKIEGIYI